MIIKPSDFSEASIVEAMRGLQFCIYDFQFTSNLLTNPKAALAKYEKHVSALLERWTVADWKDTFAHWISSPDVAPTVVLDIVCEFKAEPKMVFSMIVANWDTVTEALVSWTSQLPVNNIKTTTEE